MDFIRSNVDGIAVLDPLTFLSKRSHTLSMKWSSTSDIHWQSEQTARDVYATKYEEAPLNSDAVGLDIEQLWVKYIQPQSTEPQTEPQTEPWQSASGPLDEDSESSCGGVSDWWPEAWEHPVGFHVTTPCAHKDHTSTTTNSETRRL
jgi:hypothetical protein